MRLFILLFPFFALSAAPAFGLPLVPQPQEVAEMPGKVDLTIAKRIVCSCPAGDQSAYGYATNLQSLMKEELDREIPVKRVDGTGLSIAIVTNDDFPVSRSGVDRPEAYTLNIEPKCGVKAYAEDSAGLFYALQTLRQLITGLGYTLPACAIRDWPDIPRRAVMIDMARLKEKKDYYYDLIDFLAAHKINVVYLHFTDNGRCALQYKSRPELTTAHAFSQDQMKDLIRFADQRNVELIPEVESWGHASYILQHEKYASLSESKSTLCTLKRGTWEVLDDIYRETAALFPSKYMHIGCDEADFGQCPECKAFVAKNGKAALVAKHVAMACELAEKYGKIPVLWGDVLFRFRDNVNMLPRDAVISYWNYKPSVSPEPAEFAKSNGFAVVGCPALVWGGRMILPHGDSLENIASFSKVVRDERLAEMSTTVWVPQRYICDSLWYGLAYASNLSWSGSKQDDTAFSKAFFKEFYGIDASKELVYQAKMAHYLGLGTSSLFTDLWNYRGQFDKLSKADLLRYTIPRRDKARACVAVLKRFEPKALRHRDEYDAFLLAAEVEEFASERAASAGELRVLLSRAETGDKAALTSAISLLDSQIARQAELGERLSKFWDRRRYPDSPQKYAEGQNLLGTFNGSDRYIKAIAARLKEIQAGRSSDWEGVLAQAQ